METLPKAEKWIGTLKKLAFTETRQNDLMIDQAYLQLQAQFVSCSYGNCLALVWSVTQITYRVFNLSMQVALLYLMRAFEKKRVRMNDCFLVQNYFLRDSNQGLFSKMVGCLSIDLSDCSICIEPTRWETLEKKNRTWFTNRKGWWWWRDFAKEKLLR